MNFTYLNSNCLHRWISSVQLQVSHSPIFVMSNPHNTSHYCSVCLFMLCSYTKLHVSSSSTLLDSDIKLKTRLYKYLPQWKWRIFKIQVNICHLRSEIKWRCCPTYVKNSRCATLPRCYWCQETLQDRLLGALQWFSVHTKLDDTGQLRKCGHEWTRRRRGCLVRLLLGTYKIAKTKY